MKRKREHWAYEELRKHLEEKTESWVPHLQDASEPQIRRVTRIPDHERGRIFLMNPDLRQELDRVLLERIYPHVVETMDGQWLVVPSIEEIQRTIQDGNEWIASRVVTFLLTDPARPIMKSDEPLWYFRFTLSVRPLSYMLSSDCLVSIPFAVAGAWLLDVLTDSRIQETSPHISADVDEFILNFSQCAGENVLTDDWQAPVSALITSHLRIAEHVDQFERQPYNYRLRSKMVEVIAATYHQRVGPK